MLRQTNAFSILYFQNFRSRKERGDTLIEQRLSFVFIYQTTAALIVPDENIAGFAIY